MELATVRLICLCPKFWVESLPSEASGNLPKNGVYMAFFLAKSSHLGNFPAF